jgi:transposase
LRHFARKLRPYLPGILAHCRYPLDTNPIEGSSNRIEVIKRMAYGFRAAFPGVGRWTFSCGGSFGPWPADVHPSGVPQPARSRLQSVPALYSGRQVSRVHA